MIKIAIITILGAGLVGTGAQTLAPQELELSAGNLRVTADTTGVKTTAKSDADYAITLHMKSGRHIAVRF